MSKGQVFLNTDILWWKSLASCNPVLHPGSEAHWLGSHEQFNPSFPKRG